MEPEPVDSPAEDRKLAALLREQLSPLPPRAFTAQVMAALPPPALPVRSQGRRILLCALGAAFGLALAWQRSAPDLSPEFLRQTLQGLAEPRLLLALALTVGSIAFAFWRGPRSPHAQ